MARREIGGQGEFVDYKQLRQGDLIAAGVWVGTRKGKFSPIFEIYDEEKEETILVPGSGQLKYKMKEYCKLGNFVEIEYDGKEVMREGAFRGKDVHCFRVFVDDDYQPKTSLGQAAIGKNQDDNVFERGGDDDDGYEPPARIRGDDRGSRDRRDTGMDRRDDSGSRDRNRDDRGRDRNPPSRDSRDDRRSPVREDRPSRDSRRQEPPTRRRDDDEDDDLGLI